MVTFGRPQACQWPRPGPPGAVALTSCHANGAESCETVCESRLAVTGMTGHGAVSVIVMVTN